MPLHFASPIRSFVAVRLLPLWLMALAVGLSGCLAGKKLRHDLHQRIESSPVFRSAFTGFALYDPEKGQWLAEYQADHYFTPASNIKLFTFYLSNRINQAWLPALVYEETGDTLIFWGTGHPGLLHPWLPADSSVLAFLRKHEGPLFFCAGNFADRRFGPGWAWDDYPWYYQAEKAPLPLYANVLHVRHDSTEIGFRLSPALFADSARLDAVAADEHPRWMRDECRNRFTYNPPAVTGPAYEREIPFRWSPALAAQLLSDTLGRPVHVLALPLMPSDSAHVLYAAQPADSLYRLLLQDSDNFIAEQLLLMAAYLLTDTLDGRRAIAWALDSLLSDLPDRPLWVDGSGLSRYNLATPRTMVMLLDKIRREVPAQRLFGLLPAGGRSGTIAEWYAGPDGPYVFAKTGTLRNRHCLSGYLRTARGRWLIFSFMHNNFPGSNRAWKEEMERILEYIYQNY